MRIAYFSSLGPCFSKAGLLAGLVLACPWDGASPVAGQSLSDPPTEDTTIEQPVQRTDEVIRRLEQEKPGRVEDTESVAPLPRQKQKTKDHLHRLEEQRAREREMEREVQGPKERAREQVREFEQLAPPDEPPPEPSLWDRWFGGRFKPAGSSSAEGISPRPEATARVKYLLGVYETQIGIYDEILDKTKIGPGLLHRALGSPSWLVLGGEHRTRYEGLNSSWRTNDPNGGQVLSLRTRLQVGIQKIIDPLRFLIEIQDSRLPLSSTDAYANTNNANYFDIQQFHADLYTNNLLGIGVPSVLKVGRINMDVGRGRWVARNQFRNATNAFDGVEWQLGDERRWQLRSFLVRPVRRFMQRLDPWLASENGTFWGLYFESRTLPWFETTFHYFGHADEGPGRDFNMVGGRIRKQPAVGSFDYEIESSFQFGNINQQTRFAQFYHGELGYTFDFPWKPQALVKFDYASNGFDILYGRRSFELTPTGIFGPFQRSNMTSPGARLLVKPFDRGYIFLQYRAWWLVDGAEPWVGTGLRDPTGRSGTFVGHTFEVRARWGLNERTYLQAGYAHFAFGPFAERAPGSPVTRDAHYGYLWTEFMF